MWLPWTDAVVIAVVLGVVGLAPPLRRRYPGLAPVAREAAMVFTLYAVWQRAGAIATHSVAGAFTRAHGLWDIERRLHLPSELTVQGWVLPHPLVVQAANIYYAVLHVPLLIGTLVWLFFAHRDAYRPLRRVLALATAMALVIQMVPVAPPRMLSDLGMVDTALRYHQSVFGPPGQGISDQLSAMPSVHVLWALLVALMVLRAARSPWRWLVLAYPTLTMLVVVVTGNHFWADGIVAAGLLVVALALERSGAAVGRAVVAASRSRLRVPTVTPAAVPAPLAEPADLTGRP